MTEEVGGKKGLTVPTEMKLLLADTHWSLTLKAHWRGVSLSQPPITVTVEAEKFSKISDQVTRHNVVANVSRAVQFLPNRDVSFLLDTDHFSQTKPNPFFYFYKTYINMFFHSFHFREHVFVVNNKDMFLAPRCVHLKRTLIFHYKYKTIFSLTVCCTAVSDSTYDDEEQRDSLVQRGEGGMRLKGGAS